MEQPIKVYSALVASFVVSVSDVNAILQTISLVVAILYTSYKTIEVRKRSKTQIKNERTEHTGNTE